jgi:hypothetical protein
MKRGCRTGIFLALSLWAPAAAQQPFYTDDADVTDKRKFHVEISNQFAVLQHTSYPNLRQNAVVFQLNYGILDGLEIGVDSPLLAIYNAKGTEPLTPFGMGDTNITLKYNFHKEHSGSKLPAMTVSFAMESPTGDSRTQLGTGLFDFGLNTILQKSLTEKWVLRVNNGVLFAGNTLTGVVGLEARGYVYLGGASIVRQVTPKLHLGVEATGARAQIPELGKGQLQGQVAGKYEMKGGLSVDFGVVVGKYANSPRVGLQIGFSKDF